MRVSAVLVRLLPASFLVGAAFEAFMCLVPVGGRTFYDVARRKKAERIVDAEVAEAKAKADAASLPQKPSSSSSSPSSS